MGSISLIFLDLTLCYCFEFSQQAFVEHVIYSRHRSSSYESYKDE